MSLVLKEEASEKLLDSEVKDGAHTSHDRLSNSNGDIVMPPAEEDIEFRNKLVQWLDIDFRPHEITLFR